MPAWLIGLIPGAMSLVKGLFEKKIDSQAQVNIEKAKIEQKKAEVETAKQNAETSKNNALSAEDDKNSRLAQYNKHLYVAVILIAMVLLGLTAAIMPEIISKMILNMKQAFSEEGFASFLNLFVQIIKALVGITDQ